MHCPVEDSRGCEWAGGDICFSLENISVLDVSLVLDIVVK